MKSNLNIVMLVFEVKEKPKKIREKQGLSLFCQITSGRNKLGQEGRGWGGKGWLREGGRRAF